VIVADAGVILLDPGDQVALHNLDMKDVKEDFQPLRPYPLLKFGPEGFAIQTNTMPMGDCGLSGLKSTFSLIYGRF
jgi:hypothetical protein